MKATSPVPTGLCADVIVATMPRLANSIAPTARTFAALLWLVGALTLVCIAVARGARAGLPMTAIATANPLARSDPTSALWWDFMAKVDRSLPPGASATVYAADPGTGLRLFMLALAALPDHPLRPYWYFGTRHPESLTDSEFLLSYDCATPPSSPSRVAVIRGKSGCVFKLGQAGR